MYWMYHALTKSLVSVPDEEYCVTMAEKLENRIYFKAELTTTPTEIDSYVLRAPNGGELLFDEDKLWEAREWKKFYPDDKLLKIERRIEVFETEME